MLIFFYAESKLGSCIVGNKDFSFFRVENPKSGTSGMFRKKISAFKNAATVFFCRIYVKGFFFGGVLILGHIQVPIVRKTT